MRLEGNKFQGARRWLTTRENLADMHSSSLSTPPQQKDFALFITLWAFTALASYEIHTYKAVCKMQIAQSTGIRMITNTHLGSQHSGETCYITNKVPRETGAL